MGISLDPRGLALDFGCGVGRVTQAMSKYFDSCYGIDISPTMIDLANQFNKVPAKCHYLVNDSNRLAIFPDNKFGFVYTNIVLQHISPRYVESILREFVRISKPGGIALFQVPDRYPGDVVTVQILKLKGLKLKRILRSIGILPGKPQMEMHYMAEKKVRRILESAGADVIDAIMSNSANPTFNGRLQYLQNPPKHLHVSKQYCAMKRS